MDEPAVAAKIRYSGYSNTKRIHFNLPIFLGDPMPNAGKPDALLHAPDSHMKSGLVKMEFVRTISLSSSSSVSSSRKVISIRAPLWRTDWSCTHWVDRE